MRKMRLILPVIALSLLLCGCMPVFKTDKKTVSDTEQSSIAALSDDSSEAVSDESSRAESDESSKAESDESSKAESDESSRAESDGSSRAESDESSKVESDESSRTESDVIGDTSAQQSGQSSESSLSEEDKKILDDMHIAEERMKEVLTSEEYENADEEHKKELAIKLLSELAEEGYIIKESIMENEDSISFSYSGGILGGIQYRGFDPYMN